LMMVGRHVVAVVQRRELLLGVEHWRMQLGVLLGVLRLHVRWRSQGLLMTRNVLELVLRRWVREAAILARWRAVHLAWRRTDDLAVLRAMRKLLMPMMPQWRVRLRTPLHGRWVELLARVRLG